MPQGWRLGVIGRDLQPSKKQLKERIMKANDLSNFAFTFAGYGHYKVTYKTGRGDYWRALITDMPSIDRTKNAEWAKVDDIKHLRNLCKRNGTHYHSNGQPFNE